MNIKNMQNAYHMLRNLICCGWEFPDACAKAAQQFGVNADELRREYDEAEGGAA